MKRKHTLRFSDKLEPASLAEFTEHIRRNNLLIQLRLDNEFCANLSNNIE